MYASKFPIYFINVFLHLTVYIIFTIFPFRKDFRFSKKITALLSLIAVAFFCVSDVLFYENEAPLMSWSYILPGFTLAFVFLYSILLVKGHYLQLMFILIVCFTFHTSIISMSNVIVFYYPLKPIIPWFVDFNELLIQLGVMAILSVPMWHLTKNMFSKVLDNGMDFLEWKFTVLLPLSFLALAFVFEFFFSCKTGNGVVEISFILLYIIISYLAYLSVLKILLTSNEKHQIAERTLVATKQIDLQKEDVKKLNTFIEASARERHDFHHHINVLKVCLDSGNVEKARNYLNQYEANLTNCEEVSVCKNVAIDAIFKHFIYVGKTYGIKITYQVNIPEQISIDELELSVVVGNIIENAVEACKRQNSTNKFIDIKANVIASQLVVIITNSYDGEIVKVGDDYLSSKQKGRIGIGLDSVKKVVNKLGGNLKIEYEKEVFKAYVLLNLK